jgi:hypothetical protein
MNLFLIFFLKAVLESDNKLTFFPQHGTFMITVLVLNSYCSGVEQMPGNNKKHKEKESTFAEALQRDSHETG